MSLFPGLVSVLCSALEPGLDPTCGGDAGLDLLIGFTGQSNQIQADANATGHSDGGYGHFLNYASAIMAAMFNSTGPAASPSGPQTFTLISTQQLKAAAPAGQANQGPWLQAPKLMVLRAGFKKIGILLFQISGSSLRRHRGVNAGFPNVGQTVFQQWAAWIQARQSEYGRKMDALVRVDGETDAGDTTDAATYQQNLADDAAAYRAATGNASMWHVICELNAATSFGPNQAAIRAAQAAYVASDAQSSLINFDRFPLASDPHYASVEQNDMGDEVGATLIDVFKPGTLPTAVAGPAPAFVHASSGITSIAAPATMMPRSGPRPKSGNWEFLAVRTYSAATTIVLTDAQGFVLLTSVTSSISAGTIANNLAVYGRQIDPAVYVNGRMPPPTVSGGAATRCVSRIFECSGPAAWSVSPVGALSSGANNANSTALSIGTVTSTANNQLALIFMATAAQNNFISTITNSNLVGIAKQWDSSYNPGDAFIGLAMATATVPVSGTVLGATSVVTSLAGVNAGIILLVTP